MGLTVGTSQTQNIPLYLKFIYGGTEIAWGQPCKINDFSNSGESVDGKYRISDLDVYFNDVNGSYFATHFGRGTIGFGSSLQVVAYLGGTMEYVYLPAGSIWQQIGTAGAYAATLHTGKVYGISYKDRQLRIRSKTALALVNELKWQFPVLDRGVSCNPNDGIGYQIGSFIFFPYKFQDTYLGTTSFYDYENGRTKWTCNSYVIGSYYDDGAGGGLRGQYPAMSARGTIPVDVNYYFAGTDSGGTNFYDNYDYTKFEGTYFGPKTGTIDNEETANEYGYQSLAEAEADKASGTYSINRTRFRSSGTFSGDVMHFVSPMTIQGSPKDCYQYLMTGAMVSPFFGTSDLDTTTLNQTATSCAFSGFSKTIGFDEKNVLDSLKDIFQSTQGIFSVNPANKFEYVSYGPRNLRQTIPSLGTANIISSEFNNLEEDFYNRFLIKYRYDTIGDNFNAQYEEKTSRWSKPGDRALTLECKWISNPNEAAILAQRLRVRYENTLPRIGFTTNLNYLGYQIGTLVQITDPNSGLLAKTVQVTGFQKSWQNKTIDFEAIDGEALYQLKGFAFWGTTGTLPGDAVSNSSISGWGTNGTQPNINSALYGSQFSWW